MAGNFWNLVNAVIAKSDLLLEVVDSRMIEETRNKEIEMKVKEKGKHLIMIINKCDLVDVNILKKKKRELKAEGIDCIFLSATKRLGTSLLKRKLLRYGDREIFIGVLGYPNTGKSSIINVLKGTHAAGTSSQSNYTKAIQNIRIAPKIMLVDTPGVFTYGNHEEWHLALINARAPPQLKDPDIPALKILEIFLKNDKTKLEQRYGLKITTEDTDELLDQIALAKNKIRKGGEPNTDAMARMIVEDWQRGFLKLDGAIATDDLNDEAD